MNEPQSPGSRRIWLRRLSMAVVALVVVGFAGIQLVRFIVPEFKLDNPPTTHTIAWNSPETERLWNAACGDCHSNDTKYPWYSYIAPVGWLVAHDTHDGRRYLNISENHRVELDEMLEQITRNKMPLPIYTTMHPDAKLSDADRQALIDGLKITFAGT